MLALACDENCFFQNTIHACLTFPVYDVVLGRHLVTCELCFCYMKVLDESRYLPHVIYIDHAYRLFWRQRARMHCACRWYLLVVGGKVVVSRTSLQVSHVCTHGYNVGDYD